MLLAVVIHLMHDGPMDGLNWTPRLEIEIEKQKQKNKQTVRSGWGLLYHTILFNF